MFLGIGKQMLQATGYQVLTARTGEEILRTYRKKKADIALVMLGLVTPEPAGTVTIYRQLRRLDPHVAVLISNGYGIDKETRQVLTDSRNAFIERPFSIQELSQKIGTLLDRHKPSRTID
jgi:DNA-binding response OmpR family regulator